MGGKKELNALTDTPSALSDLTLGFMLDYVKAKGTQADKEWYKKTVNELWGTKYNNLAKANIEGVTNIPELRRQFASKFFPNLLNKKRKSGKSYLDKVNAL